MVKNLLVIDYTSTDWYSIFRGKKVSFKKAAQSIAQNTDSDPVEEQHEIKVEQCGWQDITLVSSSEKGAVVLIAGKADPPFSQQKNERMFKPDFLLVRNFPMNLHNQSFRNIVLGFMFAGIPCVNSLETVLLGADKPAVYSKLAEVKRRIARAHPQEMHLPLIPQVYCPNILSSSDHLLLDHEDLRSDAAASPEHPLMVKVGTIHAGYGKMRVETQTQWEDLRSCLMLHQSYYTFEPFIKNVVYDLRLQCIGDQFRVYKRQSDDNYKHNWGNIRFESVPHVEPRYLLWMEELKKAIPGLDCFALDVMVQKTGETTQEWVIELNDGAMGLMWEHEKDDILAIRDVVLQRMQEHFSL